MEENDKCGSWEKYLQMYPTTTVNLTQKDIEEILFYYDIDIKRLYYLMNENKSLEQRISELEDINESHRKTNGELRKTITDALEFVKKKEHLLEYWDEREDLIEILGRNI